VRLLAAKVACLHLQPAPATAPVQQLRATHSLCNLHPALPISVLDLHRFFPSFQLINCYCLRWDLPNTLLACSSCVRLRLAVRFINRTPPPSAIATQDPLAWRIDHLCPCLVSRPQSYGDPDSFAVRLFKAIACPYTRAFCSTKAASRCETQGKCHLKSPQQTCFGGS
jgi:hypothetical protein